MFVADDGGHALRARSSLSSTALLAHRACLDYAARAARSPPTALLALRLSLRLRACSTRAPRSRSKLFVCRRVSRT